MSALEQITLHNEGTAATLDVEEVAAHLRERTGCEVVTVAGSPLARRPSTEEMAGLAEQLARLKVRDTNARPQEARPAHGEIGFERRRLEKGDRGPVGVLYDGFGLQQLLRGQLARDGMRLGRVQVAFTNRLLGTWDVDDLRYHLRAIILGMPAVISTTGLVEAPAKPREFYLARQQLGIAARQELTHALLKGRFKGQFLDHDDPRLSEVCKGYAMQAVVYQLTGEAFCDDPACRLFNAHWQAELVRAQLDTEREYCPRHETALAAIARAARR
jgi:hypothetical protein